MSSERPIIGFNFIATFGHDIEMGFSKISGLSRKMSYEPYSPGAMNDYPVALRIPNKEFSILTFEKGVYQGDKSLDVFDNWVKGDKLPKTGLITIYGELDSSKKRQIVRIYSFANPIVLSYELGDLDSVSNSILIEKFQVIHNGLVRKV